MKTKYYRSFSSSEDSGKEVIVCNDDDVLVVVTIFGTYIPCGNVLKSEVDKMLLTRIKKIMNIIICPPQGNIHRTTQADVHSFAIYRLNKELNSSSLNSSIYRRGRKKGDVKIKRKFKESLTI